MRPSPREAVGVQVVSSFLVVVGPSNDVERVGIGLIERDLGD